MSRVKPRRRADSDCVTNYHFFFNAWGMFRSFLGEVKLRVDTYNGRMLHWFLRA